MTDKEKLDKIIAEIKRLRESLKVISAASPSRDTTLENIAKAALCKQILSYIDSMQEEPTTSVWHDASEKAEKGKLYLYRTNQNVVDINRSDGKEFPDYCERWAYIDDLFKL